MAAMIPAVQKPVGAAYQQVYREGSTKLSVSSSSAWMHLTAPPRKERDGGRLISFLKAPLTVDNTQAPLPAHLQGQLAKHSLHEDLHYGKVFTPL